VENFFATLEQLGGDISIPVLMVSKPDKARILQRLRSQGGKEQALGGARVTVKTRVRELLCCVCQCELEKEEKAVRLPCLHYYHGECITPWLKDVSTFVMVHGVLSYACVCVSVCLCVCVYVCMYVCSNGIFIVYCSSYSSSLSLFSGHLQHHTCPVCRYELPTEEGITQKQRNEEVAAMVANTYS
jgi:hypothetical protein